MKAKHVPSITQLAREIGLSRQWVSELFRLPDHPRPSHLGHNVEIWRRYISGRAEKIHSVAGEKARLQIDLLRSRLAREAHELDVATQTTRQSVRDELSRGFELVFKIHCEELRRWVSTLPPRLVGLDARSIFRILQDGLQESFDKCLAVLKARTGAKATVSIPIENVIELRKAANGP
jgi:hypothetical protein